ncbi:MAG: aminotransferase [bacterium]
MPNTIPADRQHAEHKRLRDEYARLKSLSLSLDMTRGKPSAAQLDLSNRVLALPADEYVYTDGDARIDTRNYGGLDGLPAVKRLFAEILEVEPQQVIVGGNSSLTLMHDTVARACLFGAVDGDRPWSRIEDRKFICPSPGYDRHFLITEHLGFELLAVEMREDGPDMDQVEEIAGADDAVKGIWCVPRHSNPDGACYGARTVRRLAEMQTAAADFRILWDNAYAEHHLFDPPPPLESIARCCAHAGNPNRVVQFASTSKIVHPGSSVAAMAMSEANAADARAHIAAQSIGPDKVNQLRLAQLFGDLAALRAHMKKHAALVKPKFDLVQEILARELGDAKYVRWTQPKGGYFISLDTADGTAARAVRLADDAGVKLTAAGAPFPYGNDPRDRNIRIAPTFPPLDDIRQATEVLAVCVQLAASE